MVKLQMAVVNFVMNSLTDENVIKEIIEKAGLKGKISEKPFTIVLPPLMLRTEVYDAMDRLEPREDRYKIEGQELWLQGSAEHVLGSMHMNEIFEEKELPVRYLGYATSFREEAGTYGKDMEGIFRMHQFDKLEMESFSTKDTSRAEHEFFVAIQRWLVEQLELPYRVIRKCTFDIGKPDARGIDIEVWLPGQGKYRETHTADYMTDYQNGVTNGAQWYMIGGGLQDYLCGYTQCRAISIHCSYTKLPSPSQMPTFWYRNKESLFALMNQCLYGIHGKVIDAENNQPIEGATIRLMGHDDQYSTVSTYSDGFFHRPVKGGTYTLKITKHGYNPYEEEVTVADGEAVNINVALTPEEGITADFTADKTLVTVGMEVHFTDDTWGEQLTSWEWTFTGGTPETSTEQNPTVTYNTAGTYNVSLTVTNEKGETDTRIKEGYIKVLNAFNMHGGSESVSEEALFCDDGGQKSNYSNNQDDTLTIYPATAGGTVLVTFQSFETEANYDYLEIYDGTTTDETTLVGSFSGDNNPGTMSATSLDCLVTRLRAFWLGT